MPPLFFEKPRGRDVSTVLAQVAGRKFDEGILLGIAARCPLGAPSVILCRPLHRGKPFPTTFWLTCPHAAGACDALEARGGVRDLEDFLQTRRDEWREYGVWHSRIRLSLMPHAARKFLASRRKAMWESLRMGRVGGTRDDSKTRVKCLHLQTASWLALGYHPGGKWLECRIPELCTAGDGHPCRKRGKRGS